MSHIFYLGNPFALQFFTRRVIGFESFYDYPILKPLKQINYIYIRIIDKIFEYFVVVSWQITYP